MNQREHHRPYLNPTVVPEGVQQSRDTLLSSLKICENVYGDWQSQDGFVLFAVQAMTELDLQRLEFMKKTLEIMLDVKKLEAPR